ncbi:hypothetical protein Q7P37_001145 [Cladosporium fusiforme]
MKSLLASSFFAKQGRSTQPTREGYSPNERLDAFLERLRDVEDGPRSGSQRELNGQQPHARECLNESERAAVGQTSTEVSTTIAAKEHTPLFGRHVMSVSNTGKQKRFLSGHSVADFGGTTYLSSRTKPAAVPRGPQQEAESNDSVSAGRSLGALEAIDYSNALFRTIDQTYRDIVALLRLLGGLMWLIVTQPPRYCYQILLALRPYLLQLFELEDYRGLLVCIPVLTVITPFGFIAIMVILITQRDVLSPEATRLCLVLLLALLALTMVIACIHHR